MKMSRKSKYSNVPTAVDGVRFDSKAEARRYGELKLLELAGQISELFCQVKYPLEVRTPDGRSVVVESYLADFTYREGGHLIVEDVKGHITRDYIRKRKWMKSVYGIEIRET